MLWPEPGNKHTPRRVPARDSAAVGMEDTQVCLVNIGPRGRTRRVLVGLAAAALAAGALVLGLPAAARPLLFVPIWFACLSWAQALRGT